MSAALTALGSSSRLGPSPSGLGSRLADGPPGLASMAILRCHFFLNLPQASWLLRMTQLRTAAQLDMGGDGWTELWGVVRGKGAPQVPRLRSEVVTF